MFQLSAQRLRFVRETEYFGRIRCYAFGIAGHAGRIEDWNALVFHLFVLDFLYMFLYTDFDGPDTDEALRTTAAQSRLEKTG